MKIVEELCIQDFPFKWVDLEYFPNSKGERKEISLLEDEDLIEELISLFYSLFNDLKDDILIFNESWWDFCLDTWDPISDDYNYDIDGKSQETKEYLLLLQESNIKNGYSGSCRCFNWDFFLSIILKCIINHEAPFSPIFYNVENNFFFYFHYSGSIGFYYSEDNAAIKDVLDRARKKYDVN